MNKRIINTSLWRGALLTALCLTAARGWSQALFYATSSASLANNTVEYVSPSGPPNSIIFTAKGSNGNPVFRCTALALDSSLQKVFLLDAQRQEIFSMNLDGSGLASVAAITPGTPTDLALDTVHQQIYITTSSYTQTNNTIQKINYDGTGETILFTATGPLSNGVSRCTALALDLLHSKIMFSDAGANALWSLPLAGGGVASSITDNMLETPLDLALDVTNQFIYFVTSSTFQDYNNVRRVDYAGATNALLLAAKGGGSVQRCTALEFDPAASKLYLTDAGASALWSLNADGTGLAAVETNVLSFPRRVRLLPSVPLIVVNFNDSGPGSLRQAILDSKVFSPIVFSNGLFATNSGVIQLATIADTTFGPSSFIITNKVTITGPVGSNGVVLARSNGAPAMRLFYVAPGASLTLNNVTLTNGLSQGGDGGSGAQRGGSGGGGAGMGGAILSFEGTLALANATLVGNEALGGGGGGANVIGGAGDGGGAGSGGGGGGVGEDGGPGGETSTGGTGGGLTGGLGGSGNGMGGQGGLAGGGGGGGSSLTSGDGSGSGGPGGFGGGGGGGGAYNTVGYGGGIGGNGGNGGFGGGGGGPGGGTPGGTNGAPGFGGGASGATDNSGNVGSGGGGGAGLGGAVCSVLGTITVTNCTFSGNQAVGGAGGSLYGSLGSNGMGFGGGMFVLDCSLDVLNGTFAYNRADQGGGGICNVGDGESSSVFLRNTILADTLAPGSDYFSTNYIEATNLNTGNNNLIQVNDGFTGGIVSTADPRLTALQNNGGPTWTHALLNESPAIDAGDNTALPATDQRGYPRVADGDGNGSAIVDLGAVEDGLVRLTAVPQTVQEIGLNGFELLLTGETNRNYLVQYSVNLANWNPVSINLVPSSGSLTLFDKSVKISSALPRFYRAFALP